VFRAESVRKSPTNELDTPIDVAAQIALAGVSVFIVFLKDRWREIGLTKMPDRGATPIIP